MDYREYHEEVAEQAKYHLETMPKEVKEAIQKANNDLYYGPSYYDAEGNESSCFDEGAIPFNFTSAVKIISDYVNENVNDLTTFEIYESEDDEDHSLIEVEERIDGSAQDIIKEMLGKELASYCR